MQTELEKWIAENVLSFSIEEILDPVKSSSVKWRRKMTIDPSHRSGADSEPLVCRSYREVKPGVWERITGQSQSKSGTIVWHLGDPRAREEPTTRAIIRHCKVWRGDLIVTASYFRVGQRSGAHLMTGGGVCRTICKPPLDREPPATVPVLRGKFGGFSKVEHDPNPDMDRWREWADMITRVRAYVAAERDANKGIYSLAHGSRCSSCGNFKAVMKLSPWRLIHGQIWCDQCYKRFDMRVR